MTREKSRGRTGCERVVKQKWCFGRRDSLGPEGIGEVVPHRYLLFQASVLLVVVPGGCTPLTLAFTVSAKWADIQS